MSRFDNLTKYQIEKAFDFIFYSECKIRENENKKLQMLIMRISDVSFESIEEVSNFLLIIVDYYYGRSFKLDTFIDRNALLFHFIF